MNVCLHPLQSKPLVEQPDIFSGATSRKEPESSKLRKQENGKLVFEFILANVKGPLKEILGFLPDN
jgi:hypothetical protein